MTDAARDEDQVSEETREAEQEEAHTAAGADRPPTPEEEELANRGSADPEVAEHEQEMNELGANVKGEGEITPS
jgi:hypothetical protein